MVRIRVSLVFRAIRVIYSSNTQPLILNVCPLLNHLKPLLRWAMLPSGLTPLLRYVIFYEVSRNPKVSPNIRKSRSLNVSCEVSCQIGLVITSKPYSSH